MTDIQTRQSTDFDYESISSGYYDQVFRKRSGMQSKWHHQKFDHLKELMGQYDNHLDLGCGPGTFIGMLDLDKKSTGVDISSKQIDYANEHYQEGAHQFQSVTPFKPLPFDDQTFDIVTIVEVVEHLAYDISLQSVREAHRVLRDGGRLIITTPNYGSLWPVIESFVNLIAEVSYEEQHITHFRKSLLAKLLNEGQFEDYSIETFQFLSPFAAALGWDFADKFKSYEPSFLTKNVGHLLIAEATK